MKIPKGMTEKQVIQTIQKVVNRIAPRYRFGFYDIEDIKQEAFILAMEGLEHYDEERPLENFLSVHVRNRLKNFKRDNFFRYEVAPSGDSPLNEERARRNYTKKYLMEPLDIGAIRDDKEKNMRLADTISEEIYRKEIFDIIDQNLEKAYRADYLRILHGVYVPKPRRKQVYDIINDILKEHLDEEGPF